MNRSDKAVYFTSKFLELGVSDLGWRGFLAAAKYFEPEILRRIPEAELKLQYREFNRRLEELSKRNGSKKMSSL